MKKFLSILAIIPTLLFAQDLVISTAAQLGAFRDQVNSGNKFTGRTVKLANDIALTGNWTPIGMYASIEENSNFFSGTFDGQGYTISGLSVNGAIEAGLFARVIDGQIKNVNIIASEIRGTYLAGGLVAYYKSTRTITNCNVQADSVVVDGISSGSTAYAGGLAGHIVGNNLHSYYYDTGYIYSLNGGNIGIVSSYASANVRANSKYDVYAGGLVGRTVGSKTTITNSYASGNVSADAVNSDAYSGGLVGYNYMVYESKAFQSPYRHYYSLAELIIENSYASGNVSANVSANSTTIYAVSGGLVGRNINANRSWREGNYGPIFWYESKITITNSYTSGNITSSNSSGGILGSCNGVGGSVEVGSGIKSGLWFVINSVYYNSAGANNDYVKPLTVSVSSNNLKKQATFVDWDFDRVWGIEEGVGYPFLKTNLSGCNVTGVPAAQTYTGEQITPEISVKCGSVTLTPDIDYVVNYGANTNVGTGTVAITGNSSGAYGGTISKTFNISKKTLKMIGTATVQDKIYDGTTTATIIDAALDGIYEGDIGKVSFIGTFTSANVGTNILVNITLTGSAATNYSIIQPTLYGTITNSVMISTIFGDVEMEYLTMQTYTGSQIKPEPVVRLKSNGTVLTKDTDYALTYGTNKNVGSGTVAITGKGDYVGLQGTVSFNIIPKTLTITGTTADKVYDGTTTATLTGATLVGVINGDEVSLPDITGTFASANAGTGIAVSINMSLTGADAANYALQPLTKANIMPKKLAENAIQPIARQTYTGLVPDVVVMDGSKTLEKGTDYTLTIPSTDVGTAIATVTGKGNYTGTATANFTIVAKTITSDMITPVPDQLYTGKAIEPALEIKNGTITLIAGTDYTVEYTNNINVNIGTGGRVTVTGIGNYSGKPWFWFNIVTKLTSSSSMARSSSSGGSTVTSSSSSEIMYDISESNCTVLDNWGNICPGTNFANIQIPSGRTLSGNVGCYYVKEIYTILQSWNTSFMFRINGEEINGSMYSGIAEIVDKIDNGYYVSFQYPIELMNSDIVGGSIPSCATPSSSSVTPSSSSVVPSSSSSNGETPIRLPQIATANKATPIHNGINLTTSTNATVRIYDMHGRMQYAPMLRQGVYNISLSHLPKGIYIASVSFGSERQVVRVAVR